VRNILFEIENYNCHKIARKRVHSVFGFALLVVVVKLDYYYYGIVQ